MLGSASVQVRLEQTSDFQHVRALGRAGTALTLQAHDLELAALEDGDGSVLDVAEAVAIADAPLLGTAEPHSRKDLEPRGSD